MKYPELPVFAFLSAALVLVPLPWHWRARNVATLSMIAWLFIVDLIYAINTIVWAGNIRNPSPVYCDISSKLVVGASYALPLATLCICKHLEMVSSSRKAAYDIADRRRRMIFEAVMCFGLPLIFMALHYVVQGHRYDIFENFGCQATVYISIPAIFIVWFPPLFFSFIAFIYAFMSLHHFIQRRLIFAAHLQNSNSTLTTNRYLRLIAMSVTTMTWGTILTSYNLYNNAFPGLRPWTNWADVHSNFSRVDFYALAGVPEYFLRATLLFWWTMPASSIIFFLFFGFGEEAKKEYLKLWTWFSKTVLRRKQNEKGSSLGKPFGSSGPRPLHLLQLKKGESSLSPIDQPLQTSFSTTSSRPSTLTLTSATPAAKKTIECSSPASSKPEASNPKLAFSDFDNDNDSTDSFTICTISYDGGPDDDLLTSSSYAHPSPYAHNHRHIPPQIHISEPVIPSPTLSYYSTSAPGSERPPSPSPSVPESVGPMSWSRSSELDVVDEEEGECAVERGIVVPVIGNPPALAYHRPFSPPNAYPYGRPPYRLGGMGHAPDSVPPPPPNGILVTVHRQASVDKMV